MTSPPRKHWLITGVSTGLGRAAQAALERGDLVVGSLRNPKQIGAFEALAPGRALAVAMDVTRSDEVRAGVDAASRALQGRVDVLVNNAGYGLIAGIEEASDDETRAQFETNVFGALAVTQAVLPAMRARRSGHVINVTSVGDHVTFAGSGIYAATKHALEAIGEALAQEAAPLWIKVTNVAPGPFRTDWAGRSLAWGEIPMDDYAFLLGARREAMRRVDGRQAGDPAKAGHAIVALADMADPPLHLPLGAFAFDTLRTRLADLSDEFARVEALGRPTDFPAAPASAG